MLDADILVDSPIIAAVKDESGLSECLKTECQVIFILFGNVCNIGEIVRKVKEGKKTAIVHMDLVTGLSSKEISVDFIKKATQADGIISTKPMMVKRAKELGLLTIQRFFIIDSIALENSKRQIEVYHPDHNFAAVRKYLQIAHRLRLPATGGSDFHIQGVRSLGCRITTVKQLSLLAQKREELLGKHVPDDNIPHGNI